MGISPISSSSGSNIQLKEINLKNVLVDKLVDNHYTGDKKVGANSFSELLRNAFYDANSIELRKDNMMQEFIVNPNSINIEELTTALAKAELTIGFVRSVADKVISAYREISNLR